MPRSRISWVTFATLSLVLQPVGAAVSDAAGAPVLLTVLSSTLFPPPADLGSVRAGIIMVRNDSGAPVTGLESVVTYYDGADALIRTSDGFGTLVDEVNPGETVPVDIFPPVNAATAVVQAVAGSAADQLANRNFRTGPIIFTAPDADGNSYVHVPITNLNRVTADNVDAVVDCDNGYAFRTYTGGSLSLAPGATGTRYGIHGDQTPACGYVTSVVVESTTGATVPLSAPLPPSDVHATGGSHGATISWTPPTDTGGLPVTFYTASALGTTYSCNSSISSCRIAGLPNGRRYAFVVSTTTTMATSPASDPSKQVLIASPPSRPRSVTAAAGRNLAKVRWAAPATNGGSIIIRFVVTSTPGGHHCSTRGARVCVVRGLVTTRSYRFSVTGTNARGTSARSALSAPLKVR
jgi:hypothetical protein